MWFVRGSMSMLHKKFHILFLNITMRPQTSLAVLDNVTRFALNLSWGEINMYWVVSKHTDTVIWGSFNHIWMDWFGDNKTVIKIHSFDSNSLTSVVILVKPRKKCLNTTFLVHKVGKKAGGLLNMNMLVSRQSYLYNGNPQTCKDSNYIGMGPDFYVTSPIMNAEQSVHLLSADGCGTIYHNSNHFWCFFVLV